MVAMMISKTTGLSVIKSNWKTLLMADPLQV
jgi:hypothetical protein